MNAELEFAIGAVRRAGEIVLSYFQKPYSVREKSRDNPVTSADIAADTFLRRAFGRRFRGDGWLSEETADDLSRLSCRRVWVVDPLDGTKEFVRGLPEFALSVALVVEGTPRLAVVYNPATGELYHATKGAGVFRNGGPATVSPRKRFYNSILLASRTELAQFPGLEEHCRIRRLGSIAYKLALVASGEGDITLSMRPKSEWDICAGTLLMRESGGIVTDLRGNEYLFNKRVPLVRSVVAANPSIYAQATRWITLSQAQMSKP